MAAKDRMQENTPTVVAERIEAGTEAQLHRVSAAGDLDRRLDELAGEWDAERVLFTASGLNALLGLALGRWVDRRWYAYVAVVAAFQVQHGVQGWCPPLALIRRLNVRTRKEIDEERMALKALRTDFGHVGGDPEKALAAARA